MNNAWAITGRWVGILAAVFGIVCGLLIIVPFNPVMPALNLDSAWAAASNAAVERGLAFGRDFIFTFGPYASVYTRMYSPGTDRLMLLASLFLASTTLMALLVSVPPSRRAWLVALPILIAMPGMHDAFLLCTPWLLVLLVAHDKAPYRTSRLLLVHAMVAACALLLLIKGSTSVSSVACVAIAALVVHQRHRLQLLLLPGAFVLYMVTFWYISGQSINALPDYLLNQGNIIEGYSDAMSMDGRWLNVPCIALACVLSIAVVIRGERCHRWAVITATALTLFIGFKAGMVRQDSHAMIAAATVLTVSSYAAFLGIDFKGHTAALLAILLSAMVIGGYESMSFGDILRRTASAVTDSYTMALERCRGSGKLEGQFLDATSAIHDVIPIPADGLSADLYTTDISAVIFSGERWFPRPIIQSYSSYTPSLIQRNVDHLKEGGPDRVYWKVYSIDRRYPSLDDGASWRWLLGSYRPMRLMGHYLVLENSRHPAALPLGPEVVHDRVALGVAVAIPGTGPSWASIRLRPSFAGQLLGILYKRPSVRMVVRYASGTTREFRMVPGMMETGFLLSPTVNTTAELTDLWTAGFGTIPPNRVPVAITLDVPDGSTWFQDRYELIVNKLAIPLASSLVSASERACGTAACPL
ncbi:hypothetical protein L2Y94_15975 [Luteibacter aegosomatis]|uniref:hypothetical protein n=1 Tax=Luteibacter aegosomatis TaxID=2911537 RepID=UPI001FF97E27|nr:hypothetical protein [Luteibacter aegosomatis]UPG84805.1 hypothetical protein L2Y94_15975 [Luteibacter aegosomatis]